MISKSKSWWYCESTLKVNTNLNNNHNKFLTYVLTKYFKLKLKIREQYDRLYYISDNEGDSFYVHPKLKPL